MGSKWGVDHVITVLRIGMVLTRGQVTQGRREEACAMGKGRRTSNDISGISAIVEGRGGNLWQLVQAFVLLRISCSNPHQITRCTCTQLRLAILYDTLPVRPLWQSILAIRL